MSLSVHPIEMIIIVEWKSDSGAKGLPEETPNDWAAKK